LVTTNGFVEPTTGRTVGNGSNAVCKEMFEAVLADFAKSIGVGENKRAVLQLDNAGWHGGFCRALPTQKPRWTDAGGHPPVSKELHRLAGELCRVSRSDAQHANLAKRGAEFTRSQDRRRDAGLPVCGWRASWYRIMDAAPRIAVRVLPGMGQDID
jgi:hypothetical protein